MAGYRPSAVLDGIGQQREAGAAVACHERNSCMSRSCLDKAKTAAGMIEGNPLLCASLPLMRSSNCSRHVL